MSDARGSATVLAAAVLTVALLAGLALATLVGHITVRASARAGADLAALAGATAARERLDGTGDAPCEVARRTAIANEVALVSCNAYDDGSVQVAVTSDDGRAKASARAGPQEMDGPGVDSG